MRAARITRGSSGGLQAFNQHALEKKFDELLKEYFSGQQHAPKKSHKRQRTRAKDARNRAANDDQDSHPDFPASTVQRFLRDSPEPTRTHLVQRVHERLLTRLRDLARGKSGINPCQQLDLICRLCRMLFDKSVAFRALVLAETNAFVDQLVGAALQQETHGSMTRKRRVVVETTSTSPRRGSSSSSNSNQEQFAEQTVLQLVQHWHEQYGQKYPQLTAAYSFLQAKGFRFPPGGPQQQQLQRQTQHAATQRATRRYQIQLQQVHKEFEHFAPEIRQQIDEMNAIFELLVPKLEQFDTLFPDLQTNSSPKPAQTTSSSLQNQQTPQRNAVNEAEDQQEDDEDIEWEDVAPDDFACEEQQQDGHAESDKEDDTHEEQKEVEEEEVEEFMDINEIVQSYGLGSASYQLTVSIPTHLVSQTTENDVLFRNLVDGMLRIHKRWLPLVTNWHRILVSKWSGAVKGTHHDGEDEEKHTEQSARQVDVIRQQVETWKHQLHQIAVKWRELMSEDHQQRQRDQVDKAVPQIVVLDDEPRPLPPPPPSSSSQQHQPTN